MVKKKLLISFSGGRTSACMLWWLMNCWQDKEQYDIVVVFANTGKEHPGTLLFVQRCSRKWNIPIVWVEAVPKQSPIRVTKRGKTVGGGWWAVTHKVVDYFTAARGKKRVDGTFEPTPFEEMISKLGIPSTSAPFCSDQLKRKAIESYLKSIGWRKYYKAIGVRIDEIDRVNEHYKKRRIIYPFISMHPTAKREVTLWWQKQDFDLEVPEGEGNCDNCWKKDLYPTLINNAKRNKQSFEWWQAMTDEYGHIQSRKGNINMKPPFNFYRGNLSSKDILKLSEGDSEQLKLFASDNKLNSCSESCEAF